MVVFLAENSRIPVDDPNTHLELTMIHEVMVLDHGGPDFAMILYAAALKLWVFGALIVGLVMPAGVGLPGGLALVAVAGMFGLAVVLGVIESTMARLRLIRVPQLLVGAATLAGVGFGAGLWRGPVVSSFVELLMVLIALTNLTAGGLEPDRRLHQAGAAQGVVLGSPAAGGDPTGSVCGRSCSRSWSSSSRDSFSAAPAPGAS